MEGVAEAGHWWTYGTLNNGTTDTIMSCQTDWHSYTKNFGPSKWVLNSPLSLILLELPLLFVTSHAIHFFLRHLGQTLIVSQIVAGILIGPSLLASPVTFKKLIPPVALCTLETISRFGFILHLFLLGVKTDMSVLKRTGSMAIILAFSGFFLSALLGLTTFHAISDKIQKSSRYTTPRLIILNSFTFFMVTSNHIFNLEIGNTELGRLASCVALILDASAMFTDTFILKFFLLEVHNYRDHSTVMVDPFKNMISVFVYYNVLFFGCRPLMVLIIQRTPVGSRMKQSHLILVLIIFFATTFVSKCINQPVSPYLLGLSLPNAPFGAILADKLEGIISGLFLPILCAITGLRENLRVLTRESIWLEMVFLMCYFGKIIGTIVASMLFKSTFNDALALALIICSKGLMEISTLLLWKDEEAVNNEQYAVGILHILIVTKLAVPLVKRLYELARGYRSATYNKKTIQESFENKILKIMVCIYEEENIPIILHILEASKPCSRCSLLSVVALHLVKLTGRTMPFREPLHLVHKSTVRQIISEHTLNAFEFMERHNQGYSRVQQYMASSPYKTMYNGICSLAHETGIHLIIIPFHKRWSVGDGHEPSCSAPIRLVNKQVLEEAPCVVGVLADKGNMTKTCWVANFNGHHHVAMLFIGGPDDHEALIYCRIFTNHPRVRLTIIWLRERYDESKHHFGIQNEDEDDLRVIKEFQYSTKDNERVMFREEYVSDGIETTKVIIQLKDVDLAIIGRWHDPYSPVISGFTDWSECADLGTLGDVLAGPDFRFSVLVIQHQPMITWIAD